MAIEERPQADPSWDADNILASVRAGLQAAQIYPVPGQDAFEASAEFATADDLRAMATSIYEKHPSQFGIAAQVHILFRWKKVGDGKLGKCPKTSGALKYETGADFYLWLAADHVREKQMTYFQVEALLAHELCHVGMDIKGNVASREHDVEEFTFVVEHYGLWRNDLLPFGKAIRQLRLEDA